ncbi:MAG TPA: hypothetical protein VK053_20885 [Jiangellaceae bacterium]|nr:hypothetical protein [Jiangellaceae bacterium]
MVDLYVDADALIRVQASVDESSQLLAEAAERIRLLETAADHGEPLRSRVAEFGYEWHQVLAALAAASAATAESLGRVSEAVENLDGEIEQQFSAAVDTTATGGSA